ncbi:MAG: NADPH-dependent FMN reductase [Halofilum sp. (in: g-proteobacteria)]|nr:NADPH-dependent FMN reductase [Halofilum sp. (in: g-proteobacteria)]
MARLIALSGSLRSGSYNTALARALAQRAPAGCEVEVVTPADVPLYDGDLEAEHGVPKGVEQLKDRIADADGLILVTPEYNQGVPGVMKNMIDWLSRPPQDIGRVFGDRAVALCGASAGAGGTRAAQYALLPTLRALGTRIWSGKTLYVGPAGRMFDDAGELVDEDIAKRADDFIAGFDRYAGGG